MELAQNFLILFALFSIVPIRFKVRERMMRNLAKEFVLNFHSEEAPRFIDFYFKILLQRKPRELNHIEGALGSHRVHVYDKVHFSLWGEPYRCIIEIDGVVLNKSGKDFNVSDYIFDHTVANYFYPFAVRKIREILQDVRQNTF